jgi:thiamine-monophosphate kinase
MAARGSGRNAELTRRRRGRDAESPGRRLDGSDEFALIEQFRSAVSKLGQGRGVLVGIGDDCAVVEAPRGASARRGLQVLTTDSMIEGVHFRRDWLTPRELGVRAFRAAVSDVAAMGARPRYVLLSLELPRDAAGFGAREALAAVRALATDASLAGAALVGGNVSGAARVGITVTVIGEAVSRPLLRSGARAGEFVFVTGSLGGAAAGCRALAARDDSRVSPRIPPARTAAWRRPPLRLDFAAALAKRGLANSMIDVSDGLLQDVGHIARSSGVSVLLDASMLPVHRAARLVAAGGRSTAVRAAATSAASASRRSPAATASAHGSHPAALAPDVQLALTGGEDYELVFTARESACDAIERIAAKYGVPISVIGVVRKGRAEVTDLAGHPFHLADKGFDHLRPKRAKGSVRPR